MIRLATRKDIPRLVDIENACFQTDQLSKRNFLYLLNKAHADTFVYEHEGMIYGYVMILFSRGTSSARLYSIAIDENHRRQGVAEALLAAAEMGTLDKDYIIMRLEVRRDNIASHNFFKKQGYKQFGIVANYYEDHMEAWRYEKWLAPHLNPALNRVPYYQQTLEFTCGPAALMMAMHSLNPEMQLDRKMELRIWREATTIYMTSGHGGCGPFGLALSAHKRGFHVDIYINNEDILLVDSVRNQKKKEVMRLVQEDFIEEISHSDISLNYNTLRLNAIREYFDNGGIPIVLISSYKIYKQKFPHWVVVTGFDEKYVYIHDPFVDIEKDETIADCINMPVLQKDFESMARYGKAGHRATLIVRKTR